MVKVPLRRALFWLVLFTVVLRLGVLSWSFVAHPELLRPQPAVEDPGPLETASPHAAAPGPRLHLVGFEASNIAEALICRDRGFADPFGVATGPTAWISPGVVALYATAFALFGCFTAGAVGFVFAVGVLLSAAITFLTATTAERLFADRRVTLLAALLAALSPFDLSLFTAASTLDLNLHAFFLLLLLHLLLGLRQGRASRNGGPGKVAPHPPIGLALGAAVATLFNPVFAVVGAGGWVLMQWGSGWRRPVTGLALLACAQAVVVGPYILYQRQALGVWVFVKSNAPFELQLGNRPEVAGVAGEATFRRHHPSQNPQELSRYRSLGEAEYLRVQWRRFQQEFSMGDFARSTLRRIGYYFFGSVSLGFDRSTAWLMLKGAVFSLVGVVLVLYPIVRRFRLRREELLVYELILLYASPHLVALVMNRYVRPVAPLVLLLAAGGAVELGRRWRRGSRSSPQTTAPQ